MSTASLPATADPAPGPHHVAIIMDGNGRWAKARGLPRVAGHRRGADAVRRVVRGAGELGIPVLTLFAFSTENWTRPADEVNDLMGLLRHYLRNELEELHKNGARLRVIGNRDGLAADIVRDIADAENMTRIMLSLPNHAELNSLPFMHTVIPNLQRLGLITERTESGWRKVGLMVDHRGTLPKFELPLTA